MLVEKPKISMQERKELRELLSVCTEGPWRVVAGDDSFELTRGETEDEWELVVDRVCQILTETVWGRHDDVFLMASSRSVIPKLLDEIERLEKVVQELETLS